MKKFSITDSEKKLLFIVLALAILAAAYFFGFTKLNDQAAVIESSNEQDAATVAKLEGMVAKQAETEAETQSFKDGIKKIVEKYPVKIPQEKAIYIVQEMQDALELDIGNIGFSMNKHAQTFSGDKAPAGKYVLLSMGYNGDYDKFKNLLQYVCDYPDRTIIPNISAVYDEKTGVLRGSVTYKMFFLTGTEKEYTDLPDLEIPAGKAGIFYSGDWYPLKEYDEMMAELEALEQQQQ